MQRNTQLEAGVARTRCDTGHVGRRLPLSRIGFGRSRAIAEDLRGRANGEQARRRHAVRPQEVVHVFGPLLGETPAERVALGQLGGSPAAIAPTMATHSMPGLAITVARVARAAVAGDASA